MAKVGYEKPEIQKVSLVNESSVADTCWGYHGTGTKMYCDLEGEGWASFEIADGSCTLNAVNVMYHTDTNNNNKPDSGDAGTALKPDDDKYKELVAILLKAGGESGNPYKGTDIVIGAPDPTWSV